MSLVGDELKDLARQHGARFPNTDLVDLAEVSRKKFTWFSVKIQQGMGVPPKPSNAQCPICKQVKLAFQLDHMGPWRTYVAALGGSHITLGPSGEYLIPRDIAKALYNDPQNLWWICSDCNGAKSDHAYDQPLVTPQNLTHGPKGVKVSDIV